MPDQQQPLFVETYEQAWQALGMVVGWKTLACAIKPEYADDPDKAGRWLLNTFNDGCRDVRHDVHLRRALRVGREHNCHLLQQFIDREAGYEPGAPAIARSKRLALLEENQRFMSRIVENQRHLERMDQADEVEKAARARRRDDVAG